MNAPRDDRTRPANSAEHGSRNSYCPDDTMQTGELFRNLAVMALAAHSVILVATAMAHIWVLVALNVASVMLYATALILNAHRWYVAVLGIGIGEVSFHAVVATVILGWSSGFHIYLLALIPLVFFFDAWSLPGRVAASLATAAGYVLLYWYAQTHAPGDMTHPIVGFFGYTNLFVGAAVLAATSYYYGRTVSHAELVLRAKNRQLDELARTDALTGLPNRREALRLTEEEEIRSIRSEGCFALVLFDVDLFKRVNDSYGHDIGDDVLREVAGRLRGTFRAQDTVARWGGEEFLVILPQTNVQGAAVAAEKARASIQGDAFTVSGQELRLTVTAGVAVYYPGGRVTDVIKDADIALYRGKETGRNRVEVVDHRAGELS